MVLRNNAFVLHSLNLVLFVAGFSHDNPNFLFRNRRVGGCGTPLYSPSMLLSTASDDDSNVDLFLDPNMDSKIVQDIKQQFEENMVNSNIPLLSDFQKYFSSLPIREDSEHHYRLCNAPYWSSDDALDYMAKSITQPEMIDDKDVINGHEPIKIKFICAPSGRGKSSSVLPAFLRALELKGPAHIPTNDDDPVYYIYMAFENNGGNWFKFTGDVDTKNPEGQGAAFIYVCLERLLNALHYKYIGASELKSYQSINMTKAVSELVAKSFPEGRVIFHLDEHTKMCEGDDGMPVQNAGAELAEKQARLDEANQELAKLKAKETQYQPATIMEFGEQEAVEIVAPENTRLRIELAALNAALNAWPAVKDAELAVKDAELAVKDAEWAVEKSKVADFRRGAMLALASAKSATVIATFTEPPDFPTNDGGSNVCRDPVALPQRSLGKIGQNVDELSFLCSRSSRNRKLRQLWATLRLRVSFNLPKCLMSIHRRQSFGQEVKAGEAFRAFQNFEEIKAILENPNMDDTAKLEESVRQVDLPELAHRKTKPNLCMMLAAVDDVKDSVRVTSCLTNLVVLRDGRLTQDLEYYLTHRDKEYEVFNQGQKRFVQLFKNSGNILSGDPLEIAYIWAIACRSAVQKGLGVGSTFTCKTISDGRLFETRHLSSFSTDEIEPNTLYAAKEDEDSIEREYSSHPLCDLFYCTDNEKEVVMISVTCGNGSTAALRVKKLMEFIQAYDGDLQLYGVCLAPNIGGDTHKEEGDVLDLRGRSALVHLGGLAQISDALFDDRDGI